MWILKQQIYMWIQNNVSSRDCYNGQNQVCMNYSSYIKKYRSKWWSCFGTKNHKMCRRASCNKQVLMLTYFCNISKLNFTDLKDFINLYTYIVTMKKCWRFTEDKTYISKKKKLLSSLSVAIYIPFSQYFY